MGKYNRSSNLPLYRGQSSQACATFILTNVLFALSIFLNIDSTQLIGLYALVILVVLVNIMFIRTAFRDPGIMTHMKDRRDDNFERFDSTKSIQ